MLVKLKSIFTAAGGGTAYAGEVIGVDESTGASLINSGCAALHKRTIEKAAHAAPVAKPIVDASELKGFAKLNYLRAEIKKRGAKPAGRTIADLAEQLKALG